MEITLEFKKFVEQKKKLLNIKPKTQSPKMSRYINYASEYKEQLEKLKEEVQEFTKYYIENSTLFQSKPSLNEYQMRIQDQIQDKIKQVTESLNELQDYLDNQEKVKNKDQRVYYQNIIGYLFEYLSKLCKDFQNVKKLNIEDKKFTKSLFESNLRNISKDFIENFKEKEEIDISQEEKEVLLQENRELYSEMNELMEDVENIERTALEVSNLLQTFEEKLTEETHQLDKIYNNVEESHEYVQNAKSELKQVGDRSMSIFQKLLIFIFIFGGFWILFLDFIN